jgi:hypothetical protein
MSLFAVQHEFPSEPTGVLPELLLLALVLLPSRRCGATG